MLHLTSVSIVSIGMGTQAVYRKTSARSFSTMGKLFLLQDAKYKVSFFLLSNSAGFVFQMKMKGVYKLSYAFSLLA